MNRRRTLLVGTYGPREGDELLAVLGGSAAAACDLVELRLDFVADAARWVAELVAAAPVPVIATCRPVRQGGAFTGSESARLDVLRAAGNAGAAWIDVEDDVADADVPQTAAKTLRSMHVDRLPQDADQVALRLLRAPADAAKLVAHHGDEADVARILDLARFHAGKLVAHVVDVPFTRCAGALLGAPWTYATLRRGGRLGLALPTVADAVRLCDLRRAREGMRGFVLLGRDVRGSVSPDMLAAALAGLESDIVPLRWSCEDVEGALATLERLGWAGAAVTIPHKVRALEWVRSRDGETGETLPGAANTVLLGSGGVRAENTDVGGILDALAGRVPDDGGRRPGLVLGAGGAARAAVRALTHLGRPAVVWARRPAEAAATGTGVRVAATIDEALAAAPAVVLDATPAGPPGGEPLIDPSRLPQDAVVLDMLVSGRPTALIAAAARAGRTAVPGFEMLLHQAARQVRLLTGRDPDVAAMRRAGEERLAAAQRQVLLVGLRCSGKTSVGRALAALLDRPFVDLDDEVERRSGRSPDQWIRAGEEGAFRAHERRALEDLAAIPGAVVAAGGGAALHRDVLEALAGSADVIRLDAADDVLLARWAATPRAALRALPPAEELARQRAERDGVHAALARITLDTSVLPADLLAEHAAAQLFDRRS